MKIFALICGIILAGVAVAIVYQAISDWRATPKEERDEVGEIIALGAGSLSKAWMRIVGAVASAISAMAWTAEALQLPQVTDAIQKYLQPQYVTMAIVAIAILGVWARNRTSDVKSIF